MSRHPAGYERLTDSQKREWRREWNQRKIKKLLKKHPELMDKFKYQATEQEYCKIREEYLQNKRRGFEDQDR